MTEDADESLPGLTLLLAEGSTDVGEHDEIQWQSALPPVGAAHLPAPAAAGQVQVYDARRLALESEAEAQLSTAAVPAAVRPARRGVTRPLG